MYAIHHFYYIFRSLFFSNKFVFFFFSFSFVFVNMNFYYSLPVSIYIIFVFHAFIPILTSFIWPLLKTRKRTREMSIKYSLRKWIQKRNFFYILENILTRPTYNIFIFPSLVRLVLPHLNEKMKTLMAKVRRREIV